MIASHVFFKRMYIAEQKSDSSFCDFKLKNQIKKKKIQDAAVGRCSSRQVFLKFFAIFTTYNIVNILTFTVATSSFTKKRLQYSCFPVNIVKFRKFWRMLYGSRKTEVIHQEFLQNI